MISVIIPIYKVEGYLDECVTSVVNQTYTDLEIILVDDGSPDRCPQMCDEWAERDSRIKVVHKRNGGLSDARNAGLEVATGDYMVFVDSDDYVDTEMYATLIRYMDDARTAFVMCPVNRVRGKEVSPYSHNFDSYADGQSMTVPQFLEAICIGRNDFNTAWNKLYRRSFLTQRFEVGRNNEDFLLFYWLCKEHYRDNIDIRVCSSTPLYFYREREGSICKQKKGNVNSLCFDILNNFREIAADLDKWNKPLIPFITKRQEDFLVKAMDLIVHYPELKEKRPDDCRKAAEEFSRLHPLKLQNKKPSYALNVFLLKYMPSVWKAYRKIKGDL